MKTNMKIAAATVTCVFTLATTFSATIAWFASNKQVETTGTTFKVKSMNSLISTVTIHNCILDLTTSSVIQFESSPIATINVASAGTTVMTSSPVDIDDYSELYPSKPVLFLFTLNSGVKNEEINLFARTNESIVDEIDEEDVTKTPLSSAVCFKSGYYTSDSFPYNNVSVSNLTTVTQFADYSANTPTFSSSINLYSGTGNTVVKYVAVVMEYEPTAIEVIRTSNPQIALDYDRIGFYCDWVMEM